MRGASFKSMEMYVGDVTRIFVRMKERCFEFRDVCAWLQAQVQARVKTGLLFRESEDGIQFAVKCR